MDDKRIPEDQAEKRDAATVAAVVSAGASVVSAGAAVYGAVQANKPKDDKPKK